MQTTRAHIGLLGLFLTLALLVPVPAAALAPIHPDLEVQLREKGVYDQVMRQLADARARGAIRNGSPEDTVYKGEPGKATTWNAIIILVDFSDFPATGNYNVPEFEDMLTSVGTYPTGSMADHYLDNSYGDFIFTGDVVGWYRMPQPYSYYSNNDGTPGTGDDNGFGNYPNNAQKLYEDAVAAADPDVDYNDYLNGNTTVQGVFIVHAGPGAETTGNPNHIWSHRSTSTFATEDRVDCTTYTHQPETQGSGMATMGVFAHEFGHSLNLPDLYDIDGSSSGIGRWCMMAGGTWNGGGATPAHFSAWCKRFLGWTTATNITTETTGVTIPSATTNNHAVRLKTSKHGPNEYLLLEARHQTGFDAAIPGAGLLVWHIDGAIGNNANESCGSTPTHPIVRLIQADGLCQMEAGISSGNAGDPFPGSGNVTRLSTLTTPDSRAYSGKKSGIVLDNITKVGSDIILDIALSETLQFNVPGEYPTVDNALGVAGDDDVVRIEAGYSETGQWTVTEGVAITGGWDATYTTQNPATPSVLEGTGALQPIVRVTGLTATVSMDNLVVRNGKGYRRFQPSDGWVGGAVAMDGGTFTATRTRFENNVAGPNDLLDSLGGALSFVDSDVTIEDCEFAGNTAKEGGAVHVSGGSLVVRNTVFEGTTLLTPPVSTVQRGGAILAENAAVQIENGEIANYSGADLGGGVYVSGGSLDLDGARVASNQSGQSGGGLYVEAAPIVATDVTLEGNSSSGFGGGLHALGGAQVDWRRGEVAGNMSASLGGGMYLDGATAGSRIGSVVFRSNSASIIGGGLVANASDFLLEHLLFYDNTGSFAAGGAQVTAGSFSLRNSIFLDNIGGGLNVGGASPQQLDYNTYFGTTLGVDIAGATPGSNSRFLDPQLVNPAAGDFYPGQGSREIDSGDPNGALDFDGSVADRGPYGGTDDVGGRPGALSDFDVVRGLDADLSWTAPAVGTSPANYAVFGDQFAQVGKAALQGLPLLTTVASPATSWLHVGATDFGYQVQAVDANGRGGSYTDLASPPTAAPTVLAFEVSLPRPNPFNPATVVGLRLPAAGHVKAEVFDLAGRRVRVLEDRWFEAGEHDLRWDGLDDRSHSVASGSYLFRLSSPAGEATRRLLLVK